MNKRIGILGGISYESTKQYYELIHKKYYDRKHDYHFPEVVVFSLNFQRFTDYENSDTEKYIEYILEGIQGLEAAKVDCIIMAANSPHSVYMHLMTQTPVPIYSISDATMKKAKELKLKRLLLFGIKHTMDSEFYPESGIKNGIDVIMPTEEEKRIIDDIIFSELCVGRVNKHSKERLLAIIHNYTVDGVILGCTELPQIIEEDDLDVEVLNTLDIHVEAILQQCLE
jgi:aspartate racemase